MITYGKYVITLEQVATLIANYYGHRPFVEWPWSNRIASSHDTHLIDVKAPAKSKAYAQVFMEGREDGKYLVDLLTVMCEEGYFPPGHYCLITMQGPQWLLNWWGYDKRFDTWPLSAELMKGRGK